MSSTAIKTDFSKKREVVLKVKRNTAKRKMSIFINTLTPGFEYRDANNNIIRPDNLLKI